MISDDAGHQWVRVGLNQGRITVTFILRRGMLTPMDHALRPAGPPCPLEQVTDGHFYADSNFAAERFGMKIGLNGIRYKTTYTNRDGAVDFHSRMTAVPRLIAPPIVHGLTMLIAGQFMQTLASGNSGRGIATSISARLDPRGGTLLHQTFSTEFRDAPALALLVRLAGAITPAHGAEVRAEERRLAPQFFDAARIRPESRPPHTASRAATSPGNPTALANFSAVVQRRSAPGTIIDRMFVGAFGHHILQRSGFRDLLAELEPLALSCARPAVRGNVGAGAQVMHGSASRVPGGC